jgi:CheY-like chemotaxis protein
MPDVNGRKLADEALKRRPDLPVLFMTGYTRNAIVHNGMLDPGVFISSASRTPSPNSGRSCMSCSGQSAKGRSSSAK